MIPEEYMPSSDCRKLSLRVALVAAAFVILAPGYGPLLAAQLAPGRASTPTTAAPAGSGETRRHPVLHKLFDDFWQHQLRRNPERATYLGDHRYDDQLYDYSEQARRTELQTYEMFRDRLRDIDPSRLSEDDRLNYTLFSQIVTDFLDLSAYPEHLMPIAQQGGPQITLGMIQQTHPFRTTRDCANYAARLRAASKQADDLIALMEEGIRRGIVRPRITIEQALPQFDNLLAEDPKDSVLYAPAKKLTDEAGGDDSRRQIEEATSEAMAALRKLRDYLRKTYLPRCRETVGIGHLPDGPAWYRRLSLYHTTTDLTPQAIHQIGLDELKRIHSDMRQIMSEVGFEGDLQAFIVHLRNDPAQHNRTPEEMLQRHAAILKRSDALLPRLFGVLPKTPYELKEIEPFRAAAAPTAYYYDAPEDGSRPAYFYVNTYRPETRAIYEMEALAYHEAQPGHHLQIAIAREKQNLPMFRRMEYITAFVEGWGLYSELLGYDLDGYKDLYSRFGQLTYDAWRASRLVVDTGMHDMGWTRQRAIDFMKTNTALSEQNIVSEIDRYIAWPGQALAYKIGQLEILRLRKEAETLLGDRFDIRAFHDELLGEGALPLSILRERMHRWIQRVRQSADSR